MDNLALSGTTAQTGTQSQFTFSRSTRPKTNKTIELPTFKTMPINQAFAGAKESILNQKNIFGDLITEGDLTIMFGRSNVGKSFLSYQIGEAIARERNVLNVLDHLTILKHGETKYYNLNNETHAQKVLYVDFESTVERDFMRYSAKEQESNATIPYVFSENFYTSFPERLSVQDNLLFIEAIELEVIKNGIKVVIIDNMSAISQDNEKAGQAVKLMNKIKDMQRRQKLTLLLMAHTPKILQGEAIIGNNLAGSSNLYNLADAVIAVNTSTMSDDLRYIKQLKSRYNEIHFHKDNVITIKFSTRPDGFKGFEFVSYESEDELIKPHDKSTKQDEEREIINLIKLLGYSIKQVADELKPKYAPDVADNTYYERIKKRVQRLKASGKLDESDNVPFEPNSEVLKTSSPDPITQKTETGEIKCSEDSEITQHQKNDKVEEMLKQLGIKSHKERENEEMEEGWVELQKDLLRFKDMPINNIDEYNDILPW